MLHTGDFKMDQTPLDNRLTDLPGFSRLGDEGVDLLLSDSTNAEVGGFIPSERDVGKVVANVIDKAQGRVIVACFASHVHRVQQVMDAAAESPDARSRWSGARWCATCRSRGSSGCCMSRTEFCSSI